MYVRSIHPWVHFIFMFVWWLFGFAAVPAWMIDNHEKFTGTGLQSPLSFLIIGTFIWLAWIYLESPKVLKAFEAAAKPSRS